MKAGILPARCCKNGEEFEIVLGYEKGSLTMIEGRKIKPGSGSKKGGLGDDGTQTMNLSDGILWGSDYHCPVCGNRNIVRCDACGRITCYDDSGTFRCSWCQNAGKVEGAIKSIDVKKDAGGQGGFVQ